MPLNSTQGEEKPRANLIDQGGQNRFDVDRPSGLKHAQQSLPHIAFNGLQGGDKIVQEAGQV